MQVEVRTAPAPDIIVGQDVLVPRRAADDLSPTTPVEMLAEYRCRMRPNLDAVAQRRDGGLRARMRGTDAQATDENSGAA